MPYFPLSEKNKTLTDTPFEVKHREDLPDDADVHFYCDGYWTLEELYKYGALPEAELKG
jgi:hypothetical protein